MTLWTKLRWWSHANVVLEIVAAMVFPVLAAATPRAVSAATPRAPAIQQDSCNAASVITGDGLGGLRIGQTVPELRLSCTVVREYEEAGQEGLPAHLVQVDFGTDTVTAELDAGRVWRIEIESPAFATGDGIRVGTPISHLLAFRPLGGAEGEGSLYVFSRDHCGLSFRMRYRIPPGGHRAHWTGEGLTTVPGDAPVDLILVVGCSPPGSHALRPLVEEA